MSEREIKVVGGVRVGSNSKALGKTTPDNPTRTFGMAVPVREVDSTIECGFQQEWGSIDEIDFAMFCGAGWGSSWMTIRHGDKRYCVSATDIAKAFLAVVES